MKNMFESAEIFEAYVRIDCNYFLLDQLNKRVQNQHRRSPIEMMVDQATGFAKAQTEEDSIELMSILENLINDKKLIEADITHTEQFLASVKSWHEATFSKK